MNNLLQDIRFGARALRRSPGFALAAAASLALGIGANTAIFTVFDAALLRPLPVSEPDGLVQAVTDRGDTDNVDFSYPHYELLRDAGVFEGVLARTPLAAAIRAGNTTEQFEGAAVTNNFFEVLGVRAELGRAIERSESHTSPVIVLNHA